MSVYIAVGTHTRSKIYHTDAECPYLKRVQEEREVPYEIVARQNRRLCKLCADKEDDKGKNSGKWAKLNHKIETGEVEVDI